MRTTEQFLSQFPHARATTLANREKIAAKLDQLKRETANDSRRPARKSIISRITAWFGRGA